MGLMQLVGMLDSPFVRRVAVTMRFLDIDYEHRPLSVLRGFDEFRKVNPLVKVPTLVCDDDTVFVDSTLIIQHVESLAGRTLMPTTLIDARRALQQVGVALAVMEKTVQRIYEIRMRPPEYVFDEWLDRIVLQLASGLDWLEASVTGLGEHDWLFGDSVSQADISTAIAWRFAVHAAAPVTEAVERPALDAFGERAEALPEFLACPLA
jgi:glutathione S-transferase